jgi:hypothetical protein
VVANRDEYVLSEICTISKILEKIEKGKIVVGEI